MIRSRRFVAASLLSSVLLLVRCSESLQPSPSSSSQTTLNYLVSGTVTETVNRVTRPLGNHTVILHVLEADGLEDDATRLLTTRNVTTTYNGYYAVPVPRSRVFVTASGRRQPCIASARIDRDTTLNVQVFPEGHPVELPFAPGPLVSGFVYERTPEGRRPVRGATARLDLAQDAYVANTETDETGRFFFCSVDARVRMDVFGGYDPYSQGGFVGGGGDELFEFDFTR